MEQSPHLHRCPLHRCTQSPAGWSSLLTSIVVHSIAAFGLHDNRAVSSTPTLSNPSLHSVSSWMEQSPHFHYCPLHRCIQSPAGWSSLLTSIIVHFIAALSLQLDGTVSSPPPLSTTSLHSVFSWMEQSPHLHHCPLHRCNQSPAGWSSLLNSVIVHSIAALSLQLDGTVSSPPSLSTPSLHSVSSWMEQSPYLHHCPLHRCTQSPAG